jgi:hypothetical protein
MREKVEWKKIIDTRKTIGMKEKIITNKAKEDSDKDSKVVDHHHQETRMEKMMAMIMMGIRTETEVKKEIEDIGINVVMIKEMEKVTKDVINPHHHHQVIRMRKEIQTVVEVITDLVVVETVRIAGIEVVGDQRRMLRSENRRKRKVVK